MGAYLSEPVTDKDTADGEEKDGLRWGAAAMQGWRTGMEDSHLACLDLRQGKSSKQAAGGTPARTTEQSIAAFAVFDGHAALEARNHLAFFHIKNVSHVAQEIDALRSMIADSHFYQA